MEARRGEGEAAPEDVRTLVIVDVRVAHRVAPAGRCGEGRRKRRVSASRRREHGAPLRALRGRGERHSPWISEEKVRWWDRLTEAEVDEVKLLLVRGARRAEKEVLRLDIAVDVPAGEGAGEGSSGGLRRGGARGKGGRRGRGANPLLWKCSRIARASTAMQATISWFILRARGGWPCQVSLNATPRLPAGRGRGRTAGCSGSTCPTGSVPGGP